MSFEKEGPAGSFGFRRGGLHAARPREGFSDPFAGQRAQVDGVHYPPKPSHEPAKAHRFLHLAPAGSCRLSLVATADPVPVSRFGLVGFSECPAAVPG